MRSAKSSKRTNATKFSSKAEPVDACRRTNARYGFDAIRTDLRPCFAKGLRLDPVKTLREVESRVSDEGEHLVLGVRALNVSGEDSVVFSLVAPSGPDTPPGLRRLCDSTPTLGGFRHSYVHSSTGRATVIPLPLAAGEATEDAEASAHTAPARSCSSGRVSELSPPSSPAPCAAHPLIAHSGAR